MAKEDAGKKADQEMDQGIETGDEEEELVPPISPYPIPQQPDPTLVVLAELSDKMDEIVSMVRETSLRVDVLESKASALQSTSDLEESKVEVLQSMAREEAPKIRDDFEPIPKKDYPDAVHLAIAHEEMEWHTVIPLRDVLEGITINQFTVPFRKGVKMEIPTSYRDDAARRGDAQENPIL